METGIQTETGEESSVEVDNTTYFKFKPWVCITVSLVSVALCLGYNLDGQENSWEKYKRWGAPSGFDIWDGDLWGLFTSNFLHTEIWHIAGNLYWLNILGKKLEFESRRPFFILFIVSSAIISSVYELMLASETGIGLSGVVYAIFGYIMVKSRYDASYKNFLGRGLIILFIAWLFICIYLTYGNVMQIGNAAHFSGLFWGMFLAYSSSKNNTWLKAKLPFTLFILSFSTIFWVHWTTGYLSYQAYKSQLKGNLKEASTIYRRLLAKNPGDDWASQNLKLLEVDSLSNSALKAHNMGNYEDATRLYKKILMLDSGNMWAKSSLKMIPANP